MGVKQAPALDHHSYRSRGFDTPTATHDRNDVNIYLYRSKSIVGTRVHIKEVETVSRIHGKDGYCAVCDNSPCKIDPPPSNEESPREPPRAIVLNKSSWLQRVIDWLFTRA